MLGFAKREQGLMVVPERRALLSHNIFVAKHTKKSNFLAILF